MIPLFKRNAGNSYIEIRDITFETFLPECSRVTENLKHRIYTARYLCRFFESIKNTNFRYHTLTRPRTLPAGGAATGLPFQAIP